MFEIPAQRAQGIALEHSPKGAEFGSGLLVVDLRDEAQSLTEGQVGPVDALGGVEVGGLEEIVEELPLPLRVVVVRERFVVVSRLGAMRGTDDAHIGRVMTYVVVKHVGHIDGLKGMEDRRVRAVDDVRRGSIDKRCRIDLRRRRRGREWEGRRDHGIYRCARDQVKTRTGGGWEEGEGRLAPRKVGGRWIKRNFPGTDADDLLWTGYPACVSKR